MKITSLIGPALAALGGILAMLWTTPRLMALFIMHWPTVPTPVAVALLLLVPAMLSGTVVAVGQALLTRK